MLYVLLAIGGVLLFALRPRAVVSTGLSMAGIRGEFFNALQSTPSYYQDLTTRVASTAESEKYRWLGTVPQMREWGTGRLAKGLRSESYDVKSLKYEATLEVDRDEIDDDQLGQIRMRINELAARAVGHKDFLLEQLFINGHSAGYNAYDGLPFFSESHESGKSGAQSNLLEYVATDPDKPTIAEFRGALGQAIAQMVTYKDDVGEPMRIMPTPAGFTCVVPATMLITAMEALSLAFTPDADAGLRPNIMRAAARVIAFPGLPDASKWYLVKTDVPVRPFIFQDRMPIEFTALEADSEDGFKRDKYLYGLRARYTMTFGYWQYAITSDFVSGT